MAAKSSGPLPRFGGPPSKSFYTCQICKKQIRRDKIKEHLAASVDMEVLSLAPSLRSQPLARLTFDKRNHTEKVQDYFDKHEQLPVDFNNSKFWIKVSQSNTESSLMSTFLLGKRSRSDSPDIPAKKVAAEEQEVQEPQMEEDPNDDLEVETAEEALETFSPEHDLVENVPKDMDQTANPLQGQDIKEVVKASLIAALKDPEAAKLLSEQIAHRIKKLNTKETEEENVDEKVWMTGEDFISCIPCLKHSDHDKVPAVLRKYKKGNFGRLKASADRFNIRH